MVKENTLLILWIIFGFVFIRAIDSVLYLFTHLVYFGTTGMGITSNILKFIIPSITLASYIIVATLILKKLRTKSTSVGIYLTEFPKRLFVILILIAVLLYPITNKLSGLFGEYSVTNLSRNSIEFVELYGWMNTGIGFSRWLMLITLAYIYFKKYNSELIKN